MGRRRAWPTQSATSSGVGDRRARRSRRLYSRSWRCSISGSRRARLSTSSNAHLLEHQPEHGADAVDPGHVGQLDEFGQDFRRRAWWSGPAPWRSSCRAAAPSNWLAGGDSAHLQRQLEPEGHPAQFADGQGILCRQVGRHRSRGRSVKSDGLAYCNSHFLEPRAGLHPRMSTYGNRHATRFCTLILLSISTCIGSLTPRIARSLLTNSL